MSIEVYINKNDISLYDVDVFEVGGEREESLTMNDLDLHSAENYVRELIGNQEYVVYYKGISE
ncbi:hypothetical protein [Bacillus phage SBSphiJ3]|nr:hypothetical protein [Bacillus phage SBSphiJ3]